MPRSAKGNECSRPKCGRAVMNRGLCKYHYPVAYPPHLRGDTDASRAREHILALRARGVTKKIMLEEYDLQDSVVLRILRPNSRIRRYTEAQVLAIPVPSSYLSTLADVDATGTHRRLRALGAIGYSQEHIGSLIGVIQRHIAAIMGRDNVSAANAAKVAKVFTELQMTPGPSDIARRYAKRHGYPPPFAWDEDTIDDPNAKPYKKSRASQRVQIIDQYHEALHVGLINAGTTLTVAAERLGVERNSLETALLRERRAQRAEQQAS